MKKLTLAIAVLAVLTISLVSFTTSTTSPKDEDQNTYIWIRMGCANVGDPNPNIGYYETSSPDMLPGNCPENRPSGVCALQFHRSQVSCQDGIAFPINGNTLWGSYRMIKYCTTN